MEPDPIELSRGPRRTQQPRGRRRLRLGACVAATSVILVLSLLIGGCGEGSSEAETTASSATEQTTSTTAQTTSMSGADLGDAVATTWQEAIQELVALLADRPEPAQVRAEVEQLKENYIQKLVEFGRQGADLDPAEKVQMNAAIASAFSAANDDWYVSYSDIYSYYADSDMEFGSLIADFNILTQYADFELLKEQAPEEAARLGIE